jgi:hypothetical protein
MIKASQVSGPGRSLFIIIFFVWYIRRACLFNFFFVLTALFTIKLGMHLSPLPLYSNSCKLVRQMCSACPKWSFSTFFLNLCSELVLHIPYILLLATEPRALTPLPPTHLTCSFYKRGLNPKVKVVQRPPTKPGEMDNNMCVLCAVLPPYHN